MPSNWLNRILKHEVAPPEQVWTNITTKLDNETEPVVLSYIERIQNHTQLPPDKAWESIMAKLEQEENEGATLNIKKSKIKPLYIKIAAAAAIAALITIAILPAKHPQKHDTTAIANPVSKNIPVNDTRKKDSAVNSILQNTAKEATATQPHNTRIPDIVKSNATIDLAQDPTAGTKSKLQNIKGQTPIDIALMNTPNTYISITGADGETVKVSTKFSNLISYLKDTTPNNRENIDIIIEEGPKWRKIFGEWRNKMTNNTVAPSLLNFMDIIELSNVLEDKNN